MYDITATLGLRLIFTPICSRTCDLLKDIANKGAFSALRMHVSSMPLRLLVG